MASIRKETVIHASAEDVWDALRDFGALHERLAPGFATDLRLEGGDRIVTFASGAVLREVLVTCDEEERRLVWSIVGGPYRHHNGSAQVFEEPGGGCRFVWTSDLLPDELGPATAAAMDQGLAAIKAAQESSRQ
jgi:hypothetical protein